MKYFKIITDKTIYTRTKHLTLIKDELYTPAEFKKIHQTFGLTKDEDYTIIDIPKSQTYFFFGARKQIINKEVK